MIKLSFSEFKSEWLWFGAMVAGLTIALTLAKVCGLLDMPIWAVFIPVYFALAYIFFVWVMLQMVFGGW